MKGKAQFQQTLASQPGFEKYSRKSRREEFLSLMETVVPWRELEAVIEPHYPKAGNGRQPVGLAIMLRVYFLQQWFNLSDPGAEDALYESPVLRRFAGVDEEQRRKNRTQARVRSKVEWPFRILKRVFGFIKARSRGLKKNHEWLLAAFALVNLYQHRKRLAPLGA